MSDVRLLTLQEIAKRLAVDPNTLRRAIRRGDLTAYRIGERQYRVRPEDLAAYLGRARIGGGEDA